MSAEDRTMPADSREIHGYPGYRVSHRGKISSCWRRAGKCRRVMGDTWRDLSPAFNKGYPRVSLCRDGKASSKFVHRLVLEAFLGPCPDGMETRHLNGDRADNRWPENLCWGDRVENASDRVMHGTHPAGAKNPAAKLAESDIPDIRARLAARESWRSIAARYGVSRGLIKMISRREVWSHVP